MTAQSPRGRIHSCRTRQSFLPFLWLFLFFMNGKSRHKSERKSSYQPPNAQGRRFHSNQSPLNRCSLCRQQRLPCEETASLSRTKSTCRNPPQGDFGTSGHCYRAQRIQKVSPLCRVQLSVVTRSVLSTIRRRTNGSSGVNGKCFLIRSLTFVILHVQRAVESIEYISDANHTVIKCHVNHINVNKQSIVSIL